MTGSTGTATTRLLALGALLLVAVIAALLVDLPSAAQLRSRMDRVGWPGALAFVAVYAVATLLPVPKNVFSIAAGAAFGLAGAVGLVLAGACLGAGVAFWIGRLLGRDAVERLTGERLARVDAALARRGFLAVLGLRLVPLVPFTALNYAAGLSAVRWSHYIVATALGIVPGTVALVALGAYGSTPASVPFVSAAVGLLVLSGLCVWAVRRRDRQPSGEQDG
jgi:uncharacterized membrane protein YdjX (TVP38/TMEM64 family)